MNAPAITMKVTLGALSGLISYCNNKKMTLAKIKCHVSNIAFVELSHPAFAHAYRAAKGAESKRTFKGVAESIQLVINAIEMAIAEAHVDAIRMEACMSELYDGNEIAFRHWAETFGFDHTDILFMRDVVSRIKHKDNASLARACTACRLYIKHNSLSKCIALLNGDLNQAALKLGLTVTSNGHDLSNPHIVNLLGYALSSGFRSDVMDALKELRDDAHANLN